MGRIEHLYAGKLINEEAYIYIYIYIPCFGCIVCKVGTIEVGNLFLCVSKVLYCIEDLISSWNLIGAKARTQKALRHCHKGFVGTAVGEIIVKDRCICAHCRPED